MIEDFFKIFPLMALKSFDFYFRPKLFLASIRKSKSESAFTLFIAISVLLAFPDILFRIIYDKPLYPRVKYDPQSVIYVNGKKFENDDGPYIREISFLNSLKSGKLDFGIGNSTLVSIPNIPDLCAIGNFEQSLGTKSRDRPVKLSDIKHLPILEVIKQPIELDDLPQLDSMIRSYSERICQKNFIYFILKNEYIILGTSSDNMQMLRPNTLMSFPWTKNDYLDVSPFTLNLGFGLVKVAIANISPSDIDLKVHTLTIASFWLALGVSIVKAFGRKKRKIQALLEDGFQLGITIMTIPLILSFAIEAVIETIGDTGCSFSFNLVSKAREYFICNPIQNWVSIACVIVLAIIPLRYFFVLSAEGIPITNTLRRSLIATAIFLGISLFVVAPVDTIAILRFKAFNDAL